MPVPMSSRARFPQAPYSPVDSSGWGTYALSLSTRRTWALQSEAILLARQAAPCCVRLGNTPANRHPPC
jgi:hypothetical protein